MTIDEVKQTQESTIDYVLALESSMQCVRSMSIVEESDLNSDHRPIIAEVEWRGLMRHGNAASQCITHPTGSMKCMCRVGICMRKSVMM